MNATLLYLLYMTPKHDLIAIGEAVLDIFLEVDEATVKCEIKRPECQICFAFGEKIPVKRMTRIPGAGNASNAAIAASRLGLKTAVYSLIGKDEAGKEILQKWKQEKVKTDYVIQDSKRPTSYSSILFREGERTILVYHEPAKYVLPPLKPAKWIYYTSLGKGHESFEKNLLKHLKDQPRTGLTFQPGTHQLRRGLDALKPVIKRSTIFIVNKEEAERLLSVTNKSVEHLLHSFLQLGTTVAVITDGHNGSYASNGKETWFQPIFDGEAYERTGAGDSFATTFTYAYMKGLTLMECLRWGTANAWSVVQFIGPQKGLLDQKGLQRVLAKFKTILPKKI